MRVISLGSSLSLVEDTNEAWVFKIRVFHAKLEELIRVRGTVCEVCAQAFRLDRSVFVPTV